MTAEPKRLPEPETWKPIGSLVGGIVQDVLRKMAERDHLERGGRDD